MLQVLKLLLGHKLTQLCLLLFFLATMLATLFLPEWLFAVLAKQEYAAACWLVYLSLAYYMLLRQGLRPYYKLGAQRASKKKKHGAGLARWRSRKSIRYWPFYILLACLATAPLYFSDDALRHIHDGYYLLQGIDVYSLSPDELPALETGRPNHPELPSIYFPFTQAQAILGAWLSPKYGFRILYMTLCGLWLWNIFRMLSFKKGLAYLSLFLSPAFCMFLASCHADMQGFLVICLLLLWLRRRSPSIPSCFAFAFHCALLAGLKPEGIWWSMCLGIYVPLTFWLSKEKQRQRTYLLIFSWLSGYALCLLLLLALAFFVLFPDMSSFRSFLDTGELFVNWFLAYNPFLSLRIELYEGLLSRPELFYIYRKQILCLAVLSFFLLPGLFMIRSKVLEQSLRSTGRWKPQVLFQTILWIGLLAILGAKGPWHPWYFLWIFPLLLKEEKEASVFVPSRSAHFLASFLSLFYIPIVELRLKQYWETETFLYCLVISLFVCALYHIFSSLQLSRSA